jgi:hypothetical protein
MPDGKTRYAPEPLEPTEVVRTMTQLYKVNRDRRMQSALNKALESGDIKSMSRVGVQYPETAAAVKKHIEILQREDRKDRIIEALESGQYGDILKISAIEPDVALGLQRGASFIATQEKFKKSQFIQKQLSMAVAEGDWDTVADIGLQNPELAKGINTAIKRREGRFEENRMNTLFSIYKNPSPDFVNAKLTERLDLLESQNANPELIQEAADFIDIFNKNPKEALNKIKQEIAFRYPEAFKTLEVQRKAEEQKIIDEHNVRAQVIQVEETIEFIDKAIQTATPFSTGIWSEVILKKIPETTAHKLRSEIKTIKARIGFEGLNRMRNTNPRGAGLGNIAVKEIEFLQAIEGELNMGLSVEDFLDVLQRARRHLNNWRGLVIDKYRAVNPETMLKTLSGKPMTREPIGFDVTTQEDFEKLAPGSRYTVKGSEQVFIKQ